MPIDVILDHPKRHLVRRIVRKVTALLGLLLTLAGLVASTFPVLVLSLVVSSLATHQELPELEPNDERFLAAATGIAIVGLFLGIRLLRGRRLLALFLRRFGFVPATQVISYSIARAAGRRWRLATLDDLETAPVGVRKRTRRVAALVGLIGLTVIVLGGLWIFRGGFDRLFNDVVEQATPPAGESIADNIGGAIGGVPVGGLVAGLILAFVVMVMSFFGVTMLFAAGSYRAARRAERHKAREIRTPNQIGPTTHAVVRGARKMLSARLVVLRVDNAVWKPVVARLAAEASAIVIDVSEPTENLLWELGAIEAYRSKWVLVGRLEEVAHLSQPATGPPDDPPRRLREALDGEQVLAYRSEGRADTKRFAAGLQAMLESLR